MPNTWTVNFYDFVVFSDTVTSASNFVSTSDSLNFAEAISTNRVYAEFLDGLAWKDIFTLGPNTINPKFTDTLTLADGMLKGSPQLISDVMILIDYFTYAPNLILDSFVFSDNITGTDTGGLSDTLSFTDVFSQNYVWARLFQDTLSIADETNWLLFPALPLVPGGPPNPFPNPWIPNFPTTQWRSGNPDCE